MARQTCTGERFWFIFKVHPFHLHPTDCTPAAWVAARKYSFIRHKTLQMLRLSLSHCLRAVPLI
jgi:hypothetical protein